MKTILIPTDFSEIADNAITYALEFSKIVQSRIVLFHAYHMPIVTTEVPMMIPTQNELEKDSLEALNKVKQRLVTAGNNVEMECVARYGLAVDEIETYAEENSVDIVIMGMRGAGVIGEKLIGSVTTALIGKVKCPVLIIDSMVKYRQISKIVLASDLKETHNSEVLEPLKEMAKMLDAHVHVLNVVREPAELVPTTEEAIVGVKLEHSLEDVDHSFHYAENEDVVDGINEYVDENNIDMVAMIPRVHSFFQGLFQEPYTKRMAFHSHVPLLILNSNND
jgi:nucleotide-binding universal stress UspA family protein